jgi:hypothetical protein
MNNRFREFAETHLGQQIVRIIDREGRDIEFAAFSREGFPAVTALVSELEPVLRDIRETDVKAFNFAKQFVGDYVGDKMRANDFEISRAAKSVPGKLFTVGAVWKKKGD